MMKGRSWRLALMGGLALAAEACGSGGADGNDTAWAAANAGASASGAAASTDPCALVTAEEVAAVIGEKVLGANAEGKACTYATEDEMASSVTLELTRTGGASDMQAARDAAGVLDRMGKSMEGAKGAEGDVGEAISGGGEPVPGIGDQAFFGTNAQLHVLKKDSYFAVSPPMMRSRTGAGNPLLSTEQRREMARAIAEKAASRL